MAIEYSIIIPCYNEGQVIQEVVTNLKAFLDQHFEDSYEIIVVDDCSTDDTLALLKKLEGIRVLRHPINRGYGASIKTGIRQAWGVFVATFDGDGQHNPANISASLPEDTFGRLGPGRRSSSQIAAQLALAHAGQMVIRVAGKLSQPHQNSRLKFRFAGLPQRHHQPLSASLR